MYKKWYELYFRFYLGLALALKKDGPGARVKEAVLYLLEAFETVMTERTKQAMSPETERFFTQSLSFFLKKINIFIQSVICFSVINVFLTFSVQLLH